MMTSSTTTEWSLTGAEGEAIIGNTHLPVGPPRGVLVIAHGFKGYKDYGMFPYLAIAAAGAGFIAHRFNFSHSGMTNRIETFERPDLFERDTCNKQVSDLQVVVEAMATGGLAGRDLPHVLFGHSRGGVGVLLATARLVERDGWLPPAGVATAAAPSFCDPFSEEHREELLATGWLESPSSRTGQTLRVGRVFLDEQIADPAGHDLLTLIADIRCPVLVVHGADDPTVPSECAVTLGEVLEARARVVIVPGADHVFNTPNPMPTDAQPSDALRSLRDALIGFCEQVMEA